MPLDVRVGDVAGALELGVGASVGSLGEFSCAGMKDRLLFGLPDHRQVLNEVGWQ